MRYRDRTTVHGTRLEHNWRQGMWLSADGHRHLVDGDRTELVVAMDRACATPAGLRHGLYREGDRPNVTWLVGRAGAFRLRTVPASLIDAYGPYRRIRA